jgi:hypothetical protein
MIQSYNNKEYNLSQEHELKKLELDLKADSLMGKNFAKYQMISKISENVQGY